MLLRFVLCLLSFLFFSCENSNENSAKTSLPNQEYTRFGGAYKSFNDMPELHMEAALRKGIQPMQTRADTVDYQSGKLIRLPDELDMFKIDKLTYSIPWLVGDASNLLVRIGLNFKDSLRSKKMPEYKLIVTSVTRTKEDLNQLLKRNRNASENSVHCYGTTFDVSWKRFLKVSSNNYPDISPEKLKLVLGQVLHDLRQRDMCYIVHERKQACFHITVR